MIKVIVVPETENFKLDVSQGEEIWINANLGVPNLDGHNARYIAPCWITENFCGVNRIYHITDTHQDTEAHTIYLGNSFVLPRIWNNMGQSRRFEYHDLSVFGMRELQNGILIPI